MSNGLQFKLVGNSGGTVIDPDGPVSAVNVLRETYGERVDWDDLLECFEERAGIAEFEGNMNRAEAERVAAEAVKRIVEARRAICEKGH